MKQTDKIRIKDIAEMANISVGTVDRVIHNRGEVKEETRQKVMKIIDEMGYTPNLLAKSLALKKLYRICVLIPSSDSGNPYWNKPLSGICQAIEEIKNFNVDVEVSHYEIDSEGHFEKAIMSIIGSAPDGIVFSPHYIEASQRIVTICSEKNIPVVFIDANIESCHIQGYFGQDAFSSGYLAARLMTYSLPANASVLVLKLAKHKATFPHLMKREEGFLNYCKNRGSTCLNIVSVEVDLSVPGEPDKTIDEIFSKPNNIKGIFVTNSRVHLVARALKKLNQPHLLLLGYDLVDENVKHLEEGTIDFLICQQSEDQGYRSVMALFNYIMIQKPVGRVNYSPIDVIMKENIAFYKK